MLNEENGRKQTQDFHSGSRDSRLVKTSHSNWYPIILKLEMIMTFLIILRFKWGRQQSNMLHSMSQKQKTSGLFPCSHSNNHSVEMLLNLS